MARPLRILYEDAFYHVTARGNERKRIFLSQSDYETFLRYLKEALQKYGAILHAFVLMPNHYHLIIQTPKANLNLLMHSLNSAYTTYFNLKGKRVGHLFQGRYKALLVDADSYLLELSRYIHLNPVRAGISESPESYRWSSYRAYALPKEETIVSRDLLWGMLGREGKKGAQAYRKFVESASKEKHGSPFERVYGGLILGGEAFVKDVLHRVKEQGLQSKEISHGRALKAGALGMNEIIDFICDAFKISKEQAVSDSPYKGYGVYLARRHTVFSNAEIGRYFGGISYSAVTKIGTRIKERMKGDVNLREAIESLEKRLSRVKG
jgi:putative transposase